jgi:hypothetical protein
LINPEKVKAFCPFCGKRLIFKGQEKDLTWVHDNGQRDLKSWYFYCGCENGLKWIWACNKETGEWHYHDWNDDKWMIKKPKSVFVFR